jgi:hypothetical protein
MHSYSTSTSATIIAAHHSGTEIVSLSARPQVTFARPWWNDPVWADRVFPYMVVGFAQTFTIQGYMFKNTTAVYLSGGPNVYNHTSALSAITAFDLFSNASSLTGRDLASQFPAFSGYRLDSTEWHVVDDNHITVSLSAAQLTGYVDLVIANIAGYSLLSQDLSGNRIVVRT